MPHRRPIPRQDLDESRIAEARSRPRGETSLADEAVAHAETIPPHCEPGRERSEPDGGEIVHRGATHAGSVAQTGRPVPMAPRRGDD